MLALAASPALAQNTRHTPARPLAPGEKEASLDEAKSRIKRTGDNQYELSGITFNSATHEIRVPAEVNMTEGNIEYALVHENGKTHESLLRTKIPGFDLNVIMLLCNYEPHLGELVSRMSRPEDELKQQAAKPMAKPGADRLKISIEWKDDKGPHTALLKEWIRNEKENRNMKADHWAYNGSELREGSYEADREGSYIAVYLDFLAIINSIELGNGDDKIWTIQTDKVPPIGTAVSLVIAPADPAAKPSTK
jgi:hypothetical protein